MATRPLITTPDLRPPRRVQPFGIDIPLGSYPANDNPPRKRIDHWPRVIALFLSFGPDFGAAAWRAKLAGYDALGFCDEVVAATEARLAWWERV